MNDQRGDAYPGDVGDRAGLGVIVIGVSKTKSGCDETFVELSDSADSCLKTAMRQT